jgi:DNA modification methylase
VIELNSFLNVNLFDGIKKMKEQGIFADLCLTDIPYDVVNRDDNGLRKLDKGNADKKTFDLIDFLKAIDEVTKGNFLIFCSTEQVSLIRNYFVGKGYTTRLCIWEKKNPSPMNGEYIYLSGVECAVYAKKKGATFNAFCKNTIFRHNVCRHEYHPTQKPLSLFTELLKDLSNENQIVLDPCAGSATTAIACLQNKRNYICFEIDKNYFDLAKERINKEINNCPLLKAVGT